MFKIGNEYQRGARKLKETLKEHITIDNHNTYCSFINEAKNNYKTMFGEELERIENEKIRLQLEIECMKTPSAGYMMTIASLVLGFVLKDVIYNRFSQIYGSNAIVYSLIYALLITFIFGVLIVRNDRKLRCYMFALQALDELEEEIEKEMSFNLTLKRLNTINKN